MDSNQKRNIYAQEALKYVPKLLTLLNRNELSPTFGCFDREYWHYRTADFPCGMSQEAVLALALLYKYPFPGNDCFGLERIKSLIVGALHFTKKSSHRDGSSDEYYPFERAQGSTAFSLYACTQAYQWLGLNDTELERFFKHRGGWLASHSEVGKLANHEAMSALALLNVFLITKDKNFQMASQKRVQNVLTLQSPEGWFVEYDGCDPGYDSWTIDFLAKYFQKTDDRSLLEPLNKAVEFMSYFMHPDSSFGGEYGSRNSYNFFPHGLEILGTEIPLATQICDVFLQGVIQGNRAYIDDNRSFSHHMSNYLQAYVDFHPTRSHGLKRNDFEKYFQQAGLYVSKKSAYYLVLSLKKGGVLKLFKDQNNIYNDAGFIGVLDNDQVCVSHAFSDKIITVRDILKVHGYFQPVSLPYMSPMKLIFFRAMLFPFSWSATYSRLIRKLLQHVLIHNKKGLPIQFEREFLFNKEGLHIKDRIHLLGKKYFKRLAIGTDHTSIYTAISNGFQKGVLHPWVYFDDKLKELKQKKEIVIQREIQ
ncbi:MAG: hypothetical protein HYS98_05465 [Deltaproteobacteria bacterium]|nr:hypothetical protein [Deltaproteobacteria bacterium]